MRHNRSTTSTAAAFCPSSPATPPRNTISIANEEPMMIASNICTRQQYLLPLPLRFTKQGHYTVIAGRTDRRAALSVLMFLYSLPNFLIFRFFAPQGRHVAPIKVKIWHGPWQLNYWWNPKKLGVQWWHRPPLSSCKVWWKSIDARRCERTKCDVFHFTSKKSRLFIYRTLAARPVATTARTNTRAILGPLPAAV